MLCLLNPDSLIEVHVHGAILKEHIDQTIMPRTSRDRYFHKYRKWEHRSCPNAHEYDAMPLFSDFLSLINTLRIQCELAEYSELDELRGQQRTFAFQLLKGNTLTGISTLLHLDEQAVHDAVDQLFAQLRQKLY